jgi:hypothetical protein
MGSEVSIERAIPVKIADNVADVYESHLSAFIRFRDNTWAQIGRDETDYEMMPEFEGMVYCFHTAFPYPVHFMDADGNLYNYDLRENRLSFRAANVRLPSEVVLR